MPETTADEPFTTLEGGADDTARVGYKPCESFLMARVLIVEDEERVRELLCEALRNHTCQSTRRLNRHCYTSTYARQEGRWQAIASHITRAELL
jgi:hypothetical protein